MKTEIQIGSVKVGPGHRPFLIAEMSGNHNHSLERAFQIIEAAAKAGAHAMKLQTYTADTMTLDVTDGDFHISDDKSLWKGRNLHDLYQEAHTPWDWHAPIMKKCQELGMLCFSTPFDESAVDFLETLNVPCYKIASFENICIPLIKKVARLKKPMIISTGMATVGELEETVRTVREMGCEDLILLKCTSTYPATPENTNVRTIPHMRELFDVQVGLSDHTMGCGVSIASVAMGATVIEKHFTLARADGGVDSSFSMEPEEFKILSTETERAWLGLGKVVYGVQSAQEQKSKAFRRSIYVALDVKAGDVLDEKNVRCVRPGFGLETKHYENILGKRVNRDLKKGMPMRLEYLQY
ncbi:MAG: pseudaminic acid synthase [Pseudobdellovibrionaceae bacterium]